MKLLPLAIAAGLAVHVDYAMAAPVGVVIVTSGRRIAVPVDMNGSVAPLSSYPSFVGPLGKMPEGKFSAWWGLTTPGPRIDVHPHKDEAGHKGGCSRKSRKASLVQSFRYIINKIRAAFGLPVTHYHHKPEWGRKHYRLKLKEDGSRVIEEVDTLSSQPFSTRFKHAMRSLSPWESWAVTFVLGCGLGAILRMFVVFGIILFRGRPGGRRCMWKCSPAEAEVPVPVLVEAAPPAYTDKVDDKSQIYSTVEGSATTTVESHKEPKDDVQEIVTVEKAENQTLMVYWKHVDGGERVNAASEFHEMYPRKLLAFYEANLKWRRDDEEDAAAE